MQMSFLFSLSIHFSSISFFILCITVLSFIHLTANIRVFLQFRGTKVLLLGVFGSNYVLCAMG